MTIGANGGIQSMTSTTPSDSGGGGGSGFMNENYITLGRNIVAPESLPQFSRSEYMSSKE